jgi:hypothetical protein
MGTGFIRGEIVEGRLRATVLKKPGMRAAYRISEAHFAEWCARYCWSSSHLVERAHPLEGPDVADVPDESSH